LLSQSEDESQTFITVVAWLFVVIGAYAALLAFQQLVIWTFFWPTDSPVIEMSLSSATLLLFDTGAVLCGIGMLNRREKALRNSVVLLWAYVAWMALGFVWGIAELTMEWSESSGRSPEASDYHARSDSYDMAWTISDIVLAIVVLVACVWLARRLSSPLIKNAYTA